MANPEHLKILKQGVEAWNKWREENPKIHPDLSDAYLSESDLSGAYLWDAKLDGADLSGAHLMNAYFRDADLLRSDMRGAHLWGTNLTGAHMREAKLFKAEFMDAVLFKTDLSKADLRMAKLSGANLSAAILSGANLSEAKLSGAMLIATNLKGSDLQHADFRACSLVRSNLTRAILTGARLYGTARDNWIIRNIKCNYVYWDEEGIQRSPKDRDLKPGEFERLYAALPTIEYIFEHGMSPLDPLIMDRVVQAIQEKRPEFDIRIDSINARGLAPSIKFTVQHEDHKEPALKEVQKEYDKRINRLEAEKDRLYSLLGQAIDKAGMKLITAGPGAIVAADGSTINVTKYIDNAIKLQKTIAKEPEESKSFAKIAKKTALDIIVEAIKDIAKGQVKEAAKQIVELGKDLGPIIAKTAAYAFFKGMF